MDEQMIADMTRAICSLNQGGYCDCIGESLGCMVGRGEPPEPSRCKMTDAALMLTTEYQMATAAHSVMAGKVAELEGENAALREKMRLKIRRAAPIVLEDDAALAPYPERRSE